MKSKEGNLKWFPIWVEKWLWGSTRLELAPDQRGVWVDLLAVASKDDGFIRANIGVPYPPQQLAGMLCIPVELLESTIEKCLEFNKLTKMPDGTLYVANWKEYRFSDRYIRKLKEESSKEEVKNNKEQNITLHNSHTAEAEPPSANEEIDDVNLTLTYNLTSHSWENITEEDKKKWQEAFPACDIDLSLKQMGVWLDSNPDKAHKKRWRRFITNWLSRNQDKGGNKLTVKSNVSSGPSEATKKWIKGE